MPYNSSKVILMVLYSSVCTLALPANCVTAWLTLLQALQGNVLAIYLFCLALCELLYASTLPLWIMYIRDNHRWGLGDRACKVTAYIFFCNIYISILFLCCISCDRFVAVVYPLQSRARRHPKVAILVSAGVFVSVGAVFSPVFKVTTNTTCFEPVLVNETTAIYYYSRFTCGFVVPLFIIAYANWQVFKSIRQCMGLSAAQKARIKRLLTAVVAIFLACFTPYHLVLLIRAAAFSSHKGNTTALCLLERDFFYTPSVVFLCLCTVHSVADPIIYLLAMDLRLREDLRHLSWSHWHIRADSTWLAASRDSEEPRLPTLPTNSGTFPTAVHPPGAQQGMGPSLSALHEEP
ncbi:probable G-protein coupled receptor 132 [Talpa occidentalis]|uniref:probable G-protein coupled receptor 132 n=1 Tax=Talpa occidentalis TaxID=50954 RepID=UPI00188F577C|nr:probable G-protein coupled receptor 132 [Talpa occidentalis]